MSKAKTEFSAAIAEQFHKLGAVVVDIRPDGIATHWGTEREADTVFNKFREMGLLDSEKFRDGCFHAVFARFPK